MFLTLSQAGLFMACIVIPAVIASSIDAKEKKTKFWVLAIYFLMLAFVFVPSLGAARESARRISCASNLKQIGTCLEMYATDNNGHFPHKDGDAGFEMLVEQNYLSDHAFYLCPSTMDSESQTEQLKSSYIYHGGLTTSSPEKTILAQDRLGNHKGYSNYLYCGMWVKGINDPNYHDPAKEPIIRRLFRLFRWR
jgi:uncharacterized protein DUF1559